MEDLSKLIESARQAFAEATQPAALEDAKAKFLGKSGTLTTMMKGLRDLAADQRKAAGAEINAAKRAVEEALNARREALAQAALEKKLAEEAIDVTLPGRTSPAGGIHPVIRTWMRIEEIFRSIGFDVASGPEIENDWYTFTALNNPLNHPARSMQDTFYVDMKDEKGLLLPLRPHTSPMQVRYSRTHKPPIKVIAPGRTYRVDSDATHSPMFHQIEGLVVDEGITMGDLKGALETLIKRLYGEDAVVRFRPHHFPFTEPSCEVDMQCFKCHGTGETAGQVCSTCHGEGWIELLGAGMVHPKVLEGCGIDSKKYSGFAFGIGLERMAMGRLRINDLRLIFDNDVRFLSQF